MVGLGYVGLPLALAFAEAGLKVIGIENDPARLANISGGVSPIEDVSTLQLSTAITTGGFTVTADHKLVEMANIVILALPTPLRDGEPDLSVLDTAANTIAPHLAHGVLVVVESTVFPGWTEEHLIPRLEKGSGLDAGLDFLVGYSPERINPGDPDFRLTNTPKIVAGIDSESLAACSSLYATLGIDIVRMSSVKSAEFTKLLENTFRMVNISLVNELMMASESLGVDLWEAIDAASTKPYGFMKFTPGPGVGGHCLPVDSEYLSWISKQKYGESLRLVEAATKVNAELSEYLARRIKGILSGLGKTLDGAEVLLLGLAYKANLGDIRESPSLSLARVLGRYGASVSAIDPHVHPTDWPDYVRPAEGVSSSQFDIGVLLTAHAGSDWTADALASGIPILDTRDYLAGPQVTTVGRVQKNPRA